MRKELSFLLSAWVGVACPVLCGIRADSGGREPVKSSCCPHGQREGNEQLPSPGPQEENPDDCFCSAHGVVLKKTDVLSPASFSRPFATDAVLALQSRVSQPLPTLPPFTPDAYRVLPLLI